MAVSYTTTYNLTKPEVGASEDQWGGLLNDNLDDLDNLLDGTTPVTGIDINGGTIDGTVIGGSTAAAGTFTALTSTDGLTVDNDGATVLTVDRATSDGTIIDVQKNGTSVGSIASRGGNSLDIKSQTNELGLGGSNAVNIYTNPANVYPAINNAVDLGVSASRFKDLYLSGGVYLGGTGSANKLDDYEEGTWTPVIEGNSTVGTGAYNVQTGSYVKVGNLVTVNCYVGVTSHTGSGSQIKIGGFPFTVANGANQYGVPSFGEIQNLTKSSDTVVSGYMLPTDTRMLLRQISTTSTADTFNIAFDVAFSVLFTVTYQAA